jgi:hypothetical protein
MLELPRGRAESDSPAPNPDLCHTGNTPLLLCWSRRHRTGAARNRRWDANWIPRGHRHGICRGNCLSHANTLTQPHSDDDQHSHAHLDAFLVAYAVHSPLADPFEHACSSQPDQSSADGHSLSNLDPNLDSDTDAVDNLESDNQQLSLRDDHRRVDYTSIGCSLTVISSYD